MRSRISAAVAAFSAVAGVASVPLTWARTLTLNDTGITQCIGPHKQWSSDCTRSRQDAAFGRDVNDADPDDGEAGFSFRKVCRSGQMAGEGTCPADPSLGNGPDDWGCVYDNVSQMTWEMKTTDGGLHDDRHYFTNRISEPEDDPNDAAWLIAATNAEALCGATNWRMPEVFELQSIMHYGMGLPGRTGYLADPVYFPNNPAGWTRSAWIGETFSRAWHLDFGLGEMRIQKRHDALGVRLVRRDGGSKASSPPPRAALAGGRFIPSADGTEVTDNLTGLVWRRCPEGIAWDAGSQTCKGTATHFTWREALRHVADQGEWRLPNIKELFSIVDLEVPSPSIDHRAFPRTPGYPPFLSTTPMEYGRDGIHLQVVEFGRGSLTNQDAFSNRWVLRLVRAGSE